MGWVLVKVVLGDQGAHGLRNEIADGSAARNPPANIRGRDIHPPGQHSKPRHLPDAVHIAPEDHEFHELPQLIDPPPGMQLRHVVRADEIIQRRVRKLRPVTLRRVDRKARPLAPQLRIIEQKPR